MPPRPTINLFACHIYAICTCAQRTHQNIINSNNNNKKTYLYRTHTHTHTRNHWLYNNNLLHIFFVFVFSLKLIEFNLDKNYIYLS